jgi:hypothetical protein
MWGATPSSLTVPVILPSPAALTSRLSSNAPQQMNTTVNSKAAKLYCFLIESPLLENEKEADKVEQR